MSERLLGPKKRGYRDKKAPFDAVVCYSLHAFSDIDVSEPTEAYIDTTLIGSSAARDGEKTFGTTVRGRPSYLTESVERTVVDDNAGVPPWHPTVRVYKAYEPWDDREVEEALTARGHVRGINLFVHPPDDLLGGIPDGTAAVVLPSASHGNKGGQVSRVNNSRGQQTLQRYIEAGGHVVLHRWSAGEASYGVPIVATISSQFAGYDVYLYGAGAVYATNDAVDHPEAGPLQKQLDRLLERILGDQPGVRRD